MKRTQSPYCTDSSGGTEGASPGVGLRATAISRQHTPVRDDSGLTVRTLPAAQHRALQTQNLQALKQL